MVLYESKLKDGVHESKKKKSNTNRNKPQCFY